MRPPRALTAFTLILFALAQFAPLLHTHEAPVACASCDDAGPRLMPDCDKDCPVPTHHHHDTHATHSCRGCDTTGTPLVAGAPAPTLGSAFVRTRPADEVTLCQHHSILSPQPRGPPLLVS